MFLVIFSILNTANTTSCVSQFLLPFNILCEFAAIVRVLLCLPSTLLDLLFVGLEYCEHYSVKHRFFPSPNYLSYPLSLSVLFLASLSDGSQFLKKQSWIFQLLKLFLLGFLSFLIKHNETQFRSLENFTIRAHLPHICLFLWRNLRVRSTLELHTLVSRLLSNIGWFEIVLS